MSARLLARNPENKPNSSSEETVTSRAQFALAQSNVVMLLSHSPRRRDVLSSALVAA